MAFRFRAYVLGWRETRALEAADQARIDRNEEWSQEWTLKGLKTRLAGVEGYGEFRALPVDSGAYRAVVNDLRGRARTALTFTGAISLQLILLVLLISGTGTGLVLLVAVLCLCTGAMDGFFHAATPNDPMTQEASDVYTALDCFYCNRHNGPVLSIGLSVSLWFYVMWSFSDRFETVWLANTIGSSVTALALVMAFVHYNSFRVGARRSALTWLVWLLSNCLFVGLEPTLGLLGAAMFAGVAICGLGLTMGYASFLRAWNAEQSWAVARHRYEPTWSGSVAMEAGERVEVKDVTLEEGVWWYIVNAQGRWGFVPGAYLSPEDENAGLA